MFSKLFDLLLSGVQGTLGTAAVPSAVVLAGLGVVLIIGGLISATDGGIIKKWLFVGITANVLFVMAAGLYVIGTTPHVTAGRFVDSTMWTAFAPVAITSTVAVALFLVAFFERLTDNEAEPPRHRAQHLHDVPPQARQQHAR